MHEQMALTRKYYTGGDSQPFSMLLRERESGRNIDRYVRYTQNLKQKLSVQKKNKEKAHEFQSLFSETSGHVLGTENIDSHAKNSQN